MIEPGPASPPRTLPAALSPAGDLRWFVGLENTCVYPRPVDAFAPLDEYKLTGHDAQWRADIDRVVALGVDGLRYGMSWPLVHTAPGRFDWRRLDAVLSETHRRGLHVIADLVHYGCPPWLDGSFADPDLAPALTEFALALTERYGEAIGSLTPVNEPLTSASFCGLRDIWPPALGSVRGWAEVAVSVAEAVQSVIREVRTASAGLPIVHVEALHLFETEDPSLDARVAELSMLADVPTDLIVGSCGPGSNAWAWLAAHGVDEPRLERLARGGQLPDIVGVNYYPDLSPRVLARSRGTVRQLTVDRWATGLARVVRHAAHRYGLPVLVTETSTEGSEQRRRAWLRAAATELRELRRDGIDVRGLTWWPLIDFVDWSFISDGNSVEEFVSGVIDHTTRRLVARALPRRRRHDGMAAFARRMGLFTLEADGLGRAATAAAAELARLAGGQGPAPTAPACWSAGAGTPGATGTMTLDRGWTLTGPDHKETPIEVPGLWEAQGHLDRDGAARYRNRFSVDDPTGHWTLRFGAVMDRARVELNGVEVGRHDLPYTPFEIDVTGLLRGRNELVVDVDDPPAGSAAHLAGAYGKQGWANHHFPSPPSMYVTYGGIWQPVTLRRHGVVAIRDLRCNLDPDNTVVTAEIHRLHPEESAPRAGIESRVETGATVEVELGGIVCSVTVDIEPGTRREVAVTFGATGLERWQPNRPVLHRCRAAVRLPGADGAATSDSSRIDVGLRTVEVVDGRLAINGRPHAMRSALVQGFHPDRLYVEGTDEEIDAEICLAQQLGFNMLRLHLRPFDPRYLDACDRLGMLLHCDTPIGEPMGHDEIDDIGPVARRCADAVAAQIRRDRSHPAIVLWSCMNEVGLGRPGLRRTDRYERFVRRIVGTLKTHDDTRPFIENDWIEPDTARLFVAPLASAHWYGHLSRRYLEDLRMRCDRLGGEPVAAAVTELGDWGLPAPGTGAGRFYDHAAAYEQMLADTFWPGSLAEFSAATQTYQGVADRLQIDTIRSSGSSAGYCLTELTDVPWEFNGVLDIDRRPKPRAAAHLVDANRAVSPILALRDFGASPRHPLRADGWIVNDSDTDLELAVRAVGGGSVTELGYWTARAHSVCALGPVAIDAPPEVEPGESEVILEARDRATGRLYRSTYPAVLHGGPPEDEITVTGADPAATSLISEVPWLAHGPSPIMIVGEDQLEDGVPVVEIRGHLARGGAALVMAQGAGAAYPGAQRLVEVKPQWSGTPFRYTTDTPVVRSFPRRAVLHVHDADIAPDTVIVPAAAVAGAAVGIFKPPPRPAAGLVVGALAVDGGLLVVCQYRIAHALAGGAATAEAVFADIVSWTLGLCPAR